MSAPRLLLVEPTASGGLAAHVRAERDLLGAAGWILRDAPVTISPRPRPLEDLVTVLRLRRAGAEAGAVHAHGLRAGALAALARPRRGPRPRLVVTLHNLPVGSRPVRLLGSLLLRIAARRADVILAVSPDLAEAARAAGARDVRHALVPAPGAEHLREIPDPRAPRTETDGPLRILVAARLAPQKGLDVLLDAVGLLPPGAAEVEIVGEGPLHDVLEARIRAEHLPAHLAGRREDVPARLAACDLVVSAARWEGQPVFLQEALHAGRALVASDAGGTRWVTGTAASLVPVGDAAALAAAILEHRDPAVRARAEERSRTRSRELPTAADMTRQLTDALAPGALPW